MRGIRHRLGLLVVAATCPFLTNCVAHHSVKRYDPVPDPGRKDGAVYIRVDSHNHKQGGLFVDDREPFTVSIHPEGPQRAISLRIDAVEGMLGSRRFDALGTSPAVFDLRESHSADMPRTFDFVPSSPDEILSIRASGSLKSPSGTRSFRVIQKFRYKEWNKVWVLTLEDLISV